MATNSDRLIQVRSRADTFTGIDFVDIVAPCDQTELRVFLITDANDLTTPFDGTGALSPDDVRIEPVNDPNLPVIQVIRVGPEGGGAQVEHDPLTQRFFIRLLVNQPGEFTKYRLRIADPLANEDLTQAPFSRIDPFFNDVEFSFKVGCADDRDCRDLPVACPTEPVVDFPVDYLARDFTSIRNALLDFAAQRYPQWMLPIEADVGVMLAEIMAALGDEFSYVQDRHSREAYLETATQRRSLRKKARLLDYEIHDGRSATTLLELTIGTDAPANATVSQGGRVWAVAEGVAPLAFEVGLGLFDVDQVGAPTKYAVHPGWNAGNLLPYCLDESQTCLDIGSTSLLVRCITTGNRQIPEKERLLDSGVQQFLLLRTDPTEQGVPVRVHFARIVDFQEFVDPLGNTAEIVTRIVWDPDDALPFQIDQASLKVSLNVVPATAGETQQEDFLIRPTGVVPATVGVAVEREGPEKGTIDERASIFLYGLSRTEREGLAFLGAALRSTRPEVRVFEVPVGSNPADNTVVLGREWFWQRTLLSADPSDVVFTMEDGSWRRIRAFRGAGTEFIHRDYASGAGFSLRFGDGEFGLIPGSGQFRMRYRTGPGELANVPAGTVQALFLPEVPQNLPVYVDAASNPVAVTSGVNQESLKDIRTLLPEAYRAEKLFAVRPDDFAEAAEKLDFVQRARGTSRWTGSWHTTFVAADAFGSSSLTADQRDSLSAWLDCIRQACRDVVVRDPNTVPIDLLIRICVEPSAHASQVALQVEEVLLGPGTARRVQGFFHPDNFTFGTPLRRAALEAAIQRVPGVRSVREMLVRLRGVRSFRRFSELTLPVGVDQVLRLDNDPLRPESGSLRLVMEGGA